MTAPPSDSTLFDCIIIGAGISGLFAAETLRSHGLGVVLLEKGRGVGGRIATRRMNGASIDHGAQFFTVKHKFFENKLNEMLRDGASAVWHENEYGATRYRGTPGMSNIGKFLAESLYVRRQQLVSQIQWDQKQWRVQCDSGDVFNGKLLLSTAPMPQTLTLLKNSKLHPNPSLLKELEDIEYQPTIAMLAVLKTPSNMQPPGIIQFNEHPVLDTIVDNHIKGSSQTPALTIHSSHPFAVKNLESVNEATAQELIGAARESIHFEVQEWALHRWRYAQCTKRHPENFVQIPEFPLWLAGDGFGNARLEDAALSGFEAAQSILNNRPE